MYFLTVSKNGFNIERRKVFDDYSAALAYTSQFYKPRNEGVRAVLSFTTEVINGTLARTFASLTRPDDLDPAAPLYDRRYHIAAKQSVAFNYDASYFFLIETEYGVRECEDMQAEEDSDE